MPTHPPRSCARFAPVVALGVLLAMRLLWLGAYPLDSDEPQHAHVAWSLAQGDTPYRDVFDNHGPLFALLYAPLMHALGERADIFWWLRLAVIPWYFLAVLSTWCIARKLYPAAVADAATLLVALMQEFFIKMGQFRTDDAWAALWLVGLALALTSPRSTTRWLLTGLSVGAALSVSQKTLPLLATALVAGGCVWLASRRALDRATAKRALAATAGGLAIPAALVFWLAMTHDLEPAWNNLVTYDMAPTGGASHAWRQACYLGLLVPVAAVAIHRMRRHERNDARWRAFLALHGVLYALLIWVAWPLSTPQDFLPVIPTIILVSAGAVASRLAADAPGARVGRLVTGVLVVLELGVLAQRAPPWRDALAGEHERLATVLRITDPADTVMDAKSGAIFRPRPYYPVIESLALRRLRWHRMDDTIPAALIAHRTMVVIPDRLPPADLAFVRRNYLPGPAGVHIGGLRLPSGTTSFEIAVPGEYTASDGTHPVAVSIDGQPLSQQWDLAAGLHTLAVHAAAPLVLSWSQAWERGWRPDRR